MEKSKESRLPLDVAQEEKGLASLQAGSPRCGETREATQIAKRKVEKRKKKEGGRGDEKVRGEIARRFSTWSIRHVQSGASFIVPLTHSSLRSFPSAASMLVHFARLRYTTAIRISPGPDFPPFSPLYPGCSRCPRCSFTRRFQPSFRPR